MNVVHQSDGNVNGSNGDEPNTQKHVHIEESEEQDEDGTKIKRIHVTERVVTTKTFQTVRRGRLILFTFFKSNFGNH
jgi:hypothetical protein